MAAPDLKREALAVRLTELEKGREALIGKLNAQIGAIEECKHWLDEISKGAEDDSAPSLSSDTQTRSKDGG